MVGCGKLLLLWWLVVIGCGLLWLVVVGCRCYARGCGLRFFSRRHRSPKDALMVVVESFTDFNAE